MSQHARPVGPTTVNAAAAFSPDMIQGSKPDRNRQVLAPRIPLPLAQTTHVVAKDEPAMHRGSHPDRNCERLGPRIPLPVSQTTHVPAPFTVDMFRGMRPDRAVLGKPYPDGRALVTPEGALQDPAQHKGYHPDRPNLYLAPQWPIQGVHLTPQDAPFSVEMAAGWLPDRVTRYIAAPRYYQPPAQVTHVAAAFSPEMGAGWHPDRAILAKPLPLGVNWWTAEVGAFSVEMAQGYHPDSPRLFLGPRLDQPPSQPNHVAAAFSPEMSAGRAPMSPVLGKPAPFGWSWWTVEVPPFSLEMVQGWHPDSPRLFVAPRFMQAPSQLTHVSAPFSIEMSQGAEPDRQRYAHPFESGLIALTPDVPAFSIEMVLGSRPFSPRLLLGARIPLPVSQTTHVTTPFSPDMAAGNHPDRALLAKPAPFGWYGSTVAVAPFSVEMTQGSLPPSPILGKPQPFGAQALPPTVVPFSVEMAQGWMPASPRIFTAPSIVQAIPPEVSFFSMEMLYVTRPERNRQLLGQQPPPLPPQPVPQQNAFSPDMVQGVTWVRPHPHVPTGWIADYAVLVGVFGFHGARLLLADSLVTSLLLADALALAASASSDAPVTTLTIADSLLED